MSGAIMQVVSFDPNSTLYRYATAPTPTLQETNTYAYNVSIDILPPHELSLPRRSDLGILHLDNGLKHLEIVLYVVIVILKISIIQ